MQPRVATGWSIGCCVALLLCAPDRAAACSGPSCVEPEFFPGRGSVPANLPAVLYWPPARWDDDSADAGPDSVANGDVRFVRLDGPTGAVDVAFELVPSDEPSTQRWAGSSGAPAYRIVPAAALQPGARYAVWARGCGGVIASDPPREPYDPTVGDEDVVAYNGVPAPQAPFAVFDVIAAAAQPSALGNVTVSASMQRKVQLGGGSGCYDLFEAATVLAEVERAGNPFFDAIAFTTYVDDEVYRPSPHLNYAPGYGDSWIGHGRDQLVALCEAGSTRPLERGQHRVRFEGRVAGADMTLVSESLEFELSCPDAVDGGSAAGVGGRDAPRPAVVDGGTAESGRGASGRGASGRGASGRGASDTPDASTPHAGARARDAKDPGGCSTGGHASGGVLAALLALAYVRRRRAAVSRARD